MRLINTFLQSASYRWATLGVFTKVPIYIGGIMVIGLAGSLPVVALFNNEWFTQEKTKSAPVDLGYGPNAPMGTARPNLKLGDVPTIPKSSAATPAANGANQTVNAAVPAGGNQVGFFGPVFSWPIIPLHVALLPDGRVLSYGTDQNGNQGGQFVYDVWDPTLGNGTAAHTILTNTTATDLFCSTASLVGTSGKMLIAGGDLTVNGVRNYSNNNVEVFTPAQNSLTSAGQMIYPRWYPTTVTLPTSDKLILGGLLSPTAGGEPTPELFSVASSTWTALNGITITTPSNTNEWYYPRAFVGADNTTYFLSQAGNIFRLTTAGAGTMQDTGALLNGGTNDYPTVMSLDKNGNPFSILAVRNNKVVQAVDISQNPPVVSTVGSLNYVRDMGNLTLLADGSILASGGSATFNDLNSAVYQTELYNRLTGTWTLGATAATPRLYHSATLLLPDGSVLTGGGGAPGPISELNAEIYYPPYLYAKDGSGNPATRPTIAAAPATLSLNQAFTMQVGAGDTISAVNLIRVGFNTHAYDPEQRLIPIPFTQNGAYVTGMLNAAPSLAPPGYYMLFVLNSNGVPAIAPIIPVLQTNLPDVVVTSLSYASSTFTAVVTNQGAAATPAGVVIGVGYSVDGAWATWGAVDGPLAAGASVTVGTNGNLYTIPNGTHTITANVNDIGRFAESDITNNKDSQTITVGGNALPDVVVTSLSYANGAFTAVVKNQGVAATPAGVVIGVGYSVDGAWATWGAADGPLAAGASATIGTNGNLYTIPAGTHTITANVNDVGRFAESNMANNTTSQMIVVP